MAEPLAPTVASAESHTRDACEVSMTDSCGGCRFWILDPDVKHEKGKYDRGHCHKNPPVLVKHEDYQWWGEWPPTHEHRWCGKYEPHPAGCHIPESERVAATDD